MRNINQSVRALIAQSPLLSECLVHDILNYSAVARKLMPEISRLSGKKNYTESSVVMALRKLHSELDSSRSHRKQSPIAIRSLTMRSQLLYVVLETSSKVPKLCQKLQKLASENLQQVLHSSLGSKFAVLAMSPLLLRRVSDLMKDEVQVVLSPNMTSITVAYGKQSADEGSILQSLLLSLRWRGILVTHVFTGFHEMTFVVQDDAADDALGALRSVTRQTGWRPW